MSIVMAPSSKVAAELGLEGIVSKRATSLYRGGPSRNWLKTKRNALAKNLNELSTDLQNFRHVLQGDIPSEDW